MNSFHWGGAARAASLGKGTVGEHWFEVQEVEPTLEGYVVANRYQLVRQLGAGAMGVVWLANDISLDTSCALKVVDASQACDADAELRIRFDREARTAAQLRGSHVVDVFDHGEWNGLLFMAMEFLDGEDLAKRLERVVRLDPRSAYEVIAQVSRALMRAHRMGVVHRDLKPENIFLVPGDEHEIAKVVDFGIAKHQAYSALDRATKSGSLVGTPYYMSPEQARGRAVDWRSDLWSLAVIVFECLTGRLPFTGDALGEIMAQITCDPIPDLAQQAPWLPPAVGAWWNTATARAPEQRFQSAKEFADAFGEAIGVEHRLAISNLMPRTPHSVGSNAGQPQLVSAPTRAAALPAQVFAATPHALPSAPPLALAIDARPLLSSPLHQAGHSMAFAVRKRLLMGGALAIFCACAFVVWHALHKAPEHVVTSAPKLEQRAQAAPIVPQPEPLNVPIGNRHETPKAASQTEATQQVIKESEGKMDSAPKKVLKRTRLRKSQASELDDKPDYGI